MAVDPAVVADVVNKLDVLRNEVEAIKGAAVSQQSLQGQLDQAKAELTGVTKETLQFLVDSIKTDMISKYDAQYASLDGKLTI